VHRLAFAAGTAPTNTGGTSVAVDTSLLEI